MSVPTTIGLIAVISLSLFSLFVLNDSIRTQIHESTTLIKGIEEQVETTKQAREEAIKELGEEVVVELDRSIAQGEQRIELLRIHQEAKHTGDSEGFYQYQREAIDQMFGRTDIEMVGGPAYVRGQYPSNFSYQASQARIDYLIAERVTPMYDVVGLVTPFDEMINPAEEVVVFMRSQPADHSFFMTMYRLFYHYKFDWLLLISCVLLFGSGLSTDHEHGLSWFFTLPHSKGKIAREKILAAISLSLFTIATCLLILFVVSVVFSGVGPANFPVLQHLSPLDDAYQIGDFSNTFSFMPVALFLFKTLLILSLQLACLLTFNFWLSTYKLNPILVALVTLTISVAGYLLTTLAPNPVTLGLPFAYLNAVGITTGQQMVETGSFMYRLGPSVFVLIVWTLLFGLLTHLRLTKRQDYV